MKRYIFANAKYKDDIEDMIQDATPQIIEPLAQLYLFPGTEICGHWRKEVWNRIPTMPLLKGRNKLPSAKFIFKNSYELFQFDIDAIVQQALDHESDLTPDYERLANMYQFKKIVRTYFTWLSEYLSKHKVVNPTDVYNELNSLGLYD